MDMDMNMNDDSLFEGMVLFDSSSSSLLQIEAASPAPAPKEEEEDNNINNNISESLPPEQQQQQQPPPLDENLFSDLTLVVAQKEEEEQQHDLQSRQSSASSRRRKRSGLKKIGYGRDDRDLHSHSPSQSNDTVVAALPSQPPLPSSTQTQTQTVEEKENENEKEDEYEYDHETSSLSQTTITKDDIKHPQEEATEEGSFCEAQELDQIKARIHDKLNHARQLVNSASALRKDSIRNRRKALENANLASLKYMELELQLEQACEAEDFETAEKVSEYLSAAEKDKQAFTNSLRQADSVIDALDLKLEQALNSYIAAEEESALLLHNYASNASSNADLSLKKATSVYTKEMDQWLSSSEDMEIKKMKLEIESHFISEAHLELNNSIEHSIQDDKREKEILCKRKDILMGELEKLLALVKEKEKEIADNDADLKVVENKISNVVSGFKEIQSNIDEKYDKLQSTIAQVKLETENLALKKEEIDNFLIQEEDKGAKLREFARISEEEAKGYRETAQLRKSLMSSILKSREDKLTLTKNEEQLLEDVKLFQHEVSAARASLQELSSRKSNIQQDIASFKQRIIFIDKRVPELEAEKKVATAARNFKEAARIAAETKTLSIEKDGMKKDMDAAILNLEKLEEEIKDTLDKLLETEGMVLLKEKELAMARYQKLLLTAATARAEKTAALEMGDVEEANLLLVEAEAADCEAEKLQSTYNFYVEDFTNLREHLISMDLVSYLNWRQLVELAESLHLCVG
ncbi:hypothetical protein RIF29_37735 [Crotalaria pallida]|uniref:UVR domain-containing protein n=1 Tax=Crotalaria pallida TaxID=3830 RepID=A0AAN9HUZ9_CROPI